MVTARANTYSVASGAGVYAGIARPSGFAAGTDTGTLVGDLWTPARTGGVVNQASWDIVPAGRWIQVAGTGVDQLTASITAPGWTSSNLKWLGVVNGWNGFVIDQAGNRVWLHNAGGHGDSSFNGSLRFECFRMSWAVERQPSDRTAWSSDYATADARGSTFTACTLAGSSPFTAADSMTATPQATAGQIAARGDTTRRYFFDQLLWDARPTSRHQYSAAVYVPGTDELVSGCRTIWRYDRASGDYTYNRVWDVTLDGAEIQGIYDEVTGEYLQAGMGDGINASRGYNLSTNTFTAWACPWLGDPWENVADCRHGRRITVWSPPYSDRTKTNYMVYDLDTRSASTARATPQYGGGISAADFKATSSGADGPGMVYVPPVNEYWILLEMAAGMTWLKLDPNTSPWTLSPKTFTGTLPTTRNKPCKKVAWMPSLNAVIFMGHESAGMYVFKFNS